MPEKITPLRVVGAAGAAGDAAPGPQRLDSRALFGGGREVIIRHDGADYRLRLTASGKLILTK